jgi:hypothetical protein
MLRYRTIVWLFLALALLLSPLAARSAEAQMRAGVQGGISVDPDQVYFGGHIRTAPLIDRLRFRPSVDVGIGEDITMVALNFDFTYGFPARGPWNFYVGAGPSVNFRHNDGGDSNSGAGFDFLLGAQQRGGLFFELKVGAGDAANLKFGVGYTFP